MPISRSNSELSFGQFTSLSKQNTPVRTGTSGDSANIPILNLNAVGVATRAETQNVQPSETLNRPILKRTQAFYFNDIKNALPVDNKPYPAQDTSNNLSNSSSHSSQDIKNNDAFSDDSSVESVINNRKRSDYYANVQFSQQPIAKKRKIG